MIAFLRKLFAPKPQRHYPADWLPHSPAICACGHTSVWDHDLRIHFQETGRIGK